VIDGELASTTGRPQKQHNTLRNERVARAADFIKPIFIKLGGLEKRVASRRPTKHFRSPFLCCGAHKKFALRLCRWSNFLVRALQLLLRPPMQNFAALRIHFMAQLHRCHFKSLNFNLPCLSEQLQFFYKLSKNAKNIKFLCLYKKLSFYRQFEDFLALGIAKVIDDPNYAFEK